MTEITMPMLAEGMTEGTIVAWLQPEGSEVRVGDELVEIESDKAAMAYQAEVAGYLEIAESAGATVRVGAVIARLHPGPPASLHSGAREYAEDVRAADKVQEAKGEPATTATAGFTLATPVARRMAALHGVDLSSVTGSGPRGRITREDVAREGGVSLDAERAGTNGTAGSASRPISRLQQTVARRMSESKATIPHFQVQAEADVGRALAMRAELDEQGVLDPVPSINDIVVKASALALRDYPLVNGAFSDEHFVLHGRVHIGIAVAAQDALVVPVIADADSRPLGDIAREARRLAGAVRNGSLTPPELAGGTFTVSNLGMFGVSAIYPVINPGQAAILGVGATRSQLALSDGAVVERTMMTLTLSCDHRILYGAEASSFLRRIIDLLEAPLGLLV